MIETASALRRAFADEMRTLELPQQLVARAIAPPEGHDDPLEASVRHLLEQLPTSREVADALARGDLDVDALIVAALRECLTLEELTDESMHARADRVRYGFVPALAQVGLWELKRRLEDTASKAATPMRFMKLREGFASFRADHEQFVTWTRTALEAELQDAAVEASVTTEFCSVDGASRRLKALELGESFAQARVTEFYDLVVVTPTEADCWRALAAVHRAGTPVPRTLEDLISAPRANGYSGILTQVSIAQRDPAAALVARIAIQTPLMNRISRFGIACPECYARLNGETSDEEPLRFVRELLTTASRGLEDDDRAPAPRTIMVLAKGGRKGLATPYSLEEGATVLDLAYKIHRNIGTDAQEGRVNGHRVGLGHVLVHNDRVEIVRSSATRRCEEDILRVSTRKAQRLLRQDLNRDEFTRGRYLIRQYLELNRGLMLEDAAEVDHAAASAAEHYRDELGDISAEALYRFVGSDDSHRGSVGARVAEALAKRRAAISSPTSSPVAEWLPTLAPGVQARTRRLKLCDVCAPGPAHTIVGLDRSQRVTVHHRQCVHVRSRSTIALEWKRVDRPVRSVITLYCEDRPLLVHSVCQRISRRGSGLEEIRATADEFGRARVIVHVHSHSALALGDLLEDLRSVRSVRTVELTSTSLPDTEQQRLARADWRGLRREMESEQEAIGSVLIEPRATDRRSGDIVLPYNEQKPAFWEDAFFGRRNEADQLIGRMSGRGQAYMLITGPRRVGKTSLAMRFADGLVAAQRPHVLRVDLRQDRGSSSVDVLWRLVAALQPLDRSLVVTQDDPREAIAALVARSEKPVVLILDEFAAVLESFRDGALGDELFAWIRTTMDGDTVTSERLNLVMVAPPEGVELLHAPGVERYLDRLVSLRLAPLDHDSAREMIRRPFIEEGVRVRTQAADALVTMTAGHPYYLILYLREIVDMLNERRTKWEVTPEDVTRSTRAVLQHPYCFSGAVNEPGAEMPQHACLRAVARLQSRPDAAVPRSEIQRRTGMVSSLVEPALARLVRYDVLERHVTSSHEPAYRFSIPLVRSWVRMQGNGNLTARPTLGSRGTR